MITKIEKVVSKKTNQEYYLLKVLADDVVICSYWLNDKDVAILKLKGEI